MVFNSIAFLIFFSLFFLAYWTVFNQLQLRVRNLFLLASSYLFYGWWDWRFLGLIAFSSAFDYFLGLKIYHAKEESKRTLFITLSLIVNLGILGFFKYFNFFVDSFIDLLSRFHITPDFYTLNIILPVGISFYTFQSLSYTIDIYKSELKPTKDIVSFFTFVAFFPQLVAGPIERARNLLPQFSHKTAFDHGRTIIGMRFVLWGFFKKIVIADNLGVLIDTLFNPSFPANLITVICGAVLFSFQIYCDFSGYSDIAVGISKMLGFELMVNFQTPYFSKSLTEFWHRWHISLSSWFRDYVYFPLGGNKPVKIRAYINLLTTFVISGLWHGANLTFVIWGALHGAMIIIEKRFRLFRQGRYRMFLIFLIVSIFWLPFRANNISHLGLIIKHAFNLPPNIRQFVTLALTQFGFVKAGLFSIIFLLFLLVEKLLEEGNFSTWVSRYGATARFSIYSLILILILLFINLDIRPYFIYFQF
jgi:alginate O-acetyltransferase complex protein AlgI